MQFSHRLLVGPPSGGDFSFSVNLANRRPLLPRGKRDAGATVPQPYALLEKFRELAHSAAELTL